MLTKTKLLQQVVTVVARMVWVNARSATTHRLNGSRIPNAAEPTTYDPLEPEVASNPFPSYRELLASGPVHYNARRNIWIISRYDHVRTALRTDDVLSSAESPLRARVPLPLILSMDRPQHTQMRRMAMASFSRGALSSWQPVVEELAERLVTGVLTGERVNVVDELAIPMPVRVIAHILGVPEGDYDNFRRWSEEVVRCTNIDVTPSGLKSAWPTIHGVAKLHGYMYDQFANGRLLASDSVLGRLAASSEDGKLDHDQLFWFAMLLLVAGNETTTNLLGTLLYNLARNPEQYELLRAQPDLVDAAVEEGLRFCSPIQSFYRTALRDYQVEDCTIPAGARVLLLYGAANRDSRQFPQPDQFLVQRNPAQHLAFGSGIHFCLGAQLARMEARAVLRQLRTRVARIEPAGQPTWTVNSNLLGLAALPLRMTSE